MTEISQAARDYLTAVEKKRQELEKSRGSATAEAFVKGQKEQGKKLLIKDLSRTDDLKAAAQNRLRGSVVKKDGPSSKFDPKKDYAAKAEPQGPPTPQGYNQRAKTLREQGYKTNPVMKPKRKPDNLGTFISTTFNGQGPFKPVSADKKAQNAAEQKAYEEANAARAARRKK